jgi:FMNH2-dependent dimethyl sulfone monooxygenase
MRFGIWTPLPHTIRPEPVMERAAVVLQTRGGTGADTSFQFAIDVLQKAERLGFETTLIAERFLGPDLEAWITAGAIARETKTIEIMPAVHPGIVTPQVVAKMAATLDRISGGRCAINLVNGWWKDEFNLFGNGTWLEREDARYRRMDEFLQVMKGLWTQDTFSLQGEFYHVDAGSLPTKPCQQPHPPLYTGSRSPVAKDIVARLCDVMFVLVRPEHRKFEQNFKLIADDIADMDRRAHSHGRTLRYGINCHVICADTVEAAQAEADQLEANKSDWISGLIAKALGGGLIGTPEVIAERIKRYEALGVECLMLTFHPMIEGMERFAAEVMPLLGRGRAQPKRIDETGEKALARR